LAVLALDLTGNFKYFFQKSLVINYFLLSLPSANKKSGSSSKKNASLFDNFFKKNFEKMSNKFGG
jgi:hypothetical protein